MNELGLLECWEAVVHATPEQRAAIAQWLAGGGKGDVEVSKAELTEVVAKLTAVKAPGGDKADEAEREVCAVRGGKRCPFCMFSSFGFCVLSRLFPGPTVAAAGPKSGTDGRDEAEACGRALIGALGLGVKDMLAKVHQEIAAVARNHYELEREVSELRQLQAEGFFKFALRVDGEDFRAFAVIMALGNWKAAAEFLQEPLRRFYERVEKWAGRGPEYQRLYRLVGWRKRSGRKIKLRLEDSVQSGEPNDGPENPGTVGEVLDAIRVDDSRGYPAILMQVLEALRKQNTGNWMEVRDELVEMLRDEGF